MNGINSVGARLGEYLDYFLQPVVKETKAYLKDTKHLIQILEEITLDEEPNYLVTADVTSLYTNISHQDALSAARWALRKYSNLKCKQRKYLLESLEYSLSHNYYWYDHNYYRQIQGVAMRAKYAPSVANLHMAQWEDDFYI